ncbi:hypothetical protein NDU88_003978 [Pleurodeles waltl]|uniref:Uncharacterized protein n=1 Tax=Pleurodeles waltl TaxID=8319 RepID=A0AAV7NIJ2_PLEWA|nr:hypothetical protein NDU88_003978 [Pleurodeles waltl]
MRLPRCDPLRAPGTSSGLLSFAGRFRPAPPHHSVTPSRITASSHALLAAEWHGPASLRTEALARRGNPAQQDGNYTAVAGPTRCA